jgi:RNA polymerase-binding transcription factor DksA
MTASALETGGYWLCIRCGQEWDANRLATRAAYTDYAERTPAIAFTGVAR